MKLSPIHQTAIGLGAQFKEEDGWKTASVYSTIAEEQKAAKRRVALVDQSNYTQIIVEGETAEAVVKKAKANGYKIRPDVFLVTAGPNTGPELVAKLEKAISTGKLVTVTESPHGNGNLRLIGPDSDDCSVAYAGLICMTQ